MSPYRDLLSDMPDVILQHILSFLPSRQSARSSVLSRRWLHLWRCVPTLHFDTNDHTTPLNRREIIDASRELADWINQFLNLRDPASPLLRFYLRIHFEFHHQGNPLLDWLGYAGSHGVRDMALQLPWLDVPPSLGLPRGSLCTFNTLPFEIVAIKLKALTLHLPCPIESHQIWTLNLSSCRALQELTLYRRQNAIALNLTAPHLQRLIIIDDALCYSYDYLPPIEIACLRLEIFHLTNLAHLKDFEGHMPSLLEASIDFSCYDVKLDIEFQQVFKSICNVKKLTLNLKANLFVNLNPWKFFYRMGCFPIFHKLKHLKFKSCFREICILRILLNFLFCCPNLLSLHLIDDIDEPKVYIPGIAEGIASQGRDRLPVLNTLDYMRPLDHLEIVSVKGISDIELRSDVLKILSAHVSEWQNVVVIS